MLVLRSEVRADDAEGAGFGVRAGGVVFDEERGGVVAGVAVCFEEERGAEPGGEGLAALAVGVEDVAEVVVVGAEGGVVFGEAVEYAEVGLEGFDLLAATELGDGEGVERDGTRT